MSVLETVTQITTPLPKKILRQSLRACRQSLTPDSQRFHAEAVAAHLLSAYPWRAGMRVAITQSFDGELDTKPTIDVLMTHGVELYLPVIQSDKQLLFAPYCLDVSLAPNVFGINEPTDQTTICQLAHLDVIILPLVGFDHVGNRLGMGGGYYDRTLAENASDSLCLIGLAHSCQQVDKLPIEPWDVPLNMIITELGFKWFHYCSSSQ